MAKPSFKKQLLERQTLPAPVQVGIPQMDPFAPAARPAVAAPTAAPVEVATEQPRAAVSAPKRAAATQKPAAAPQTPVAIAPEPVAEGRQLLTRTVDHSERLQQRGFHMYPQRHRQLLELAFIEERKPWMIIEDALQDYVERNYGAAAKPAPSTK